MEEQKEIRIEVPPNSNVRELIDNIRSTDPSVVGFEIGEPRIVIKDTGEQEIVVPYTEPAIEPIDEEVRRR